MNRWPANLRPASPLKNWLEDTGSLTARLVSLSGGIFRVSVERQCLAIPTLGERQVLGLRRPVAALIREVVLIGEAQSWVFARSVLPITSLRGTLRHLRKQGARPLGAFLFSQPRMQRSAIEVARINHNQGYVPARLLQGDQLWGRRSVFYLDAKPLLVSEVFLPAFCRRIGSRLTSRSMDPGLDTESQHETEPRP